MQTRAIAAHFTFGPQRNVYHTDLLLRYRAYANERVCAADNQKEEFPDWQKTLAKWGVNPVGGEKHKIEEMEEEKREEEEKGEEKKEEEQKEEGEGEAAKR